MSFLSDPISAIGEWLVGLFTGWGAAPEVATAIVKLLGAGAVGTFGLALVIFTIWLERKLYARIQDRLGPNRVGPWGILQTFPDMVKIFTKEYITPDGADKVVFNLAPILMVSAVLLVWGVIPFASTVIGTDVNVGVLYIVAIGSIGTLSIIMAGWSSNNKYALIGAFRTVAQMVSYEVPMVLALLVPVLLARTMGINSLVFAQDVWFVALAPLAALMFLITSIAEIGRAPFDLLEAESEIVAGYQIEYSGLKFGMFYVGDFLHAFTISALTATLFFGGWRGPGAEAYPILGVAYFFIKSFLLYFVVVLARIALPRFRIDQMLNFNWKFLTPLALVLLMATAVVEKLITLYLPSLDLSDTMFMVVRTLAHISVNVIVAWGALRLANHWRLPEPKVVGQPRPVAVPPNPPASAIP